MPTFSQARAALRTSTSLKTLCSLESANGRFSNSYGASSQNSPPQPGRQAREWHKAIGATPSLIDVATGVRYELSDSMVTVGRSHFNDVVLNDPSVSLQHALISCVNGRFRVEDLCAANGTRVNGVLITGLTTLHHNDRLQLGESVLAVNLPQ